MNHHVGRILRYGRCNVAKHSAEILLRRIFQCRKRDCIIDNRHVGEQIYDRLGSLEVNENFVRKFREFDVSMKIVC